MAILGRLVTLAACLLTIVLMANAYCEHTDSIISCCSYATPKYKNGRIVSWTCMKCDSGFQLSKNKQQCLLKDQCPPGQGKDQFNNCQDCIVKNCDSCAHFFAWCDTCSDGYLADGDGNCVPKVYMN